MNERMPVRGLRHAFRTEVEIGWGAEVLKCVTRDIGDMGMFIETEHPLWLRAEFTARLKLGEVLEIDCIVRRVEPGRGMAVEFKDLPEAEREQIDLFLGKLSRK
ncbi:MAG TPA: PilZ domain-containing protein [Candidatus Acidoferrales bacterium]|nr:PilZ domain-containing protein [Candidatus Acidoferrales bacterium]